MNPRNRHMAITINHVWKHVPTFIPNYYLENVLKVAENQNAHTRKWRFVHAWVTRKNLLYFVVHYKKLFSCCLAVYRNEWNFADWWRLFAIARWHWQWTIPKSSVHSILNALDKSKCFLGKIAQKARQGNSKHVLGPQIEFQICKTRLIYECYRWPISYRFQAT